MADLKFRVDVVMCPDKALENNEPHASWPRYPGLRVQFDDVGGAVQESAVTNAAGLATSPSLPPGTYTVSADAATVPPKWTARTTPDPLRVSAAGAKQRQLITLVPDIHYRLLPLLLCREQRDGKTAPLPGAKVTVNDVGDSGWTGDFTASGNGCVYALVPHQWGGKDITAVRLQFQKAGNLEPTYREITFGVPKPQDTLVEIPAFVYAPAGPQHEDFHGISVKPKIRTLAGREAALVGAKVAVKLHGAPAGAAEHVRTLEDKDEGEVRFPSLEPGVYVVTVKAPATFDGWPIKGEPKEVGPHYLRADEHFAADVAPFGFEQINLLLKTPDGRPLDGELQLVIFGPEGSVQVSARGGKFSAAAPSRFPLKIKLAPGAAPSAGGIPLEMRIPGQDVEPPPLVTEVSLQYQHAIMGRAVDESGRPMPGAVVVLYDGAQEAARAVADANGNFTAGLRRAGSYSIAIQTEGGQPVSQRLVTVQSVVHAGDVVYRHWEPLGRDGAGRDTGGRADTGPGQGATREAFTDLAAYPVLTEEISTTGPPAPAGGARGGAGGDYGQVVGQVVRDVLGWRPSTDVGGFQAALAGAFQLREVEGHTEWTWQQRGYAVQADMGALTGAQASIYARAKSALDQILPLLAGLTPLNPALFPPQDLEAIRTVISTELTELVNELALEGGPRIQRVDELFTLLLGEGIRSRNLNPDVVQGQLGKLRDRFGLTVDQIRTVDEERVVTNFRTIVEHVLALHASWNTDRGLLSPFDPRASFGTVLIWLSRSLEAVSESVDDLEFALDSVFVDAAQRQVISLNLPGEKALLLSDLLDWIRRASRDEGPRIIQDAGKDGVFAFAPVLRRLRGLIRQTRQAARHDGSLPQGLKTPRVDRALGVLVDQLEEAARLAGRVRSDAAPHINEVLEVGETEGNPPTVTVALAGTNFRQGAKAILIPVDRDELADVHSRGVTVTPPAFAAAVFNDPRTKPGGAKASWQVMLVNPDGAQSNEADALAPQIGDL